MDNLEADCWYWVSHHSKGAIFSPVRLGFNGMMFMDGKYYPVKDFDGLGLTFTKAIMPEIEHG